MLEWTSSHGLAGSKETSDDFRGALPFPFFVRDLPAAGGGEAVEAGAAIVLGRTPVGGDEAFLLELEQRGIERAVVDGERVAGDLLDAAGDAVSVQRAHGLQRFEHHESERTLPDFGFAGQRTLLLDSNSTME